MRCVLHDDAALDLMPGGRPLISRAELVGTVFAAAAAVLESGRALEWRTVGDGAMLDACLQSQCVA